MTDTQMIDHCPHMSHLNHCPNLSHLNHELSPICTCAAIIEVLDLKGNDKPIFFSSNGLLLGGNKPLFEPMSTKHFLDIFTITIFVIVIYVKVSSFGESFFNIICVFFLGELKHSVDRVKSCDVWSIYVDIAYRHRSFGICWLFGNDSQWF